ncbi:Hint domain-containing protein [Roseovarius aestuariivivens]|uniref:Hint domain-containing protein n=1 Tax=Roseovarius aestuariivivens TaxID=1888910 RepID=UPI001081194D|nr:Hint domain-containing protein [Roseovarius aestuariivivens]
MFGWMSARAEQKDGRHGFAGLSRAATSVEAGLIAGTSVATAMGWRPVEAIAEGDKVLTFDSGLQTVHKVSRIRLWSAEDDCPRQFWPLEVPAGALGNRDVMHVLPGQNVMIESDAAEDLYGDPFSLIPAEAIEGTNGVERVPPQGDIEVIVLHFADDQIVFANNGALFFCPACHDVLQAAASSEQARPHYAILPMDEARFLAVHLEEEATTDRTYSPQDVWAAAAPA